MTPANKQKPDGHGLAPASPLLDCSISKDPDLVPVLPWTADKSSEHGRNPDLAQSRTRAARAWGAFLGVLPPVALLLHFFILPLHNGAHLSPCVSFVAAQSGNVLLKAGKKVENFRNRWVLMCLEDANPGLEEPKGLWKKTLAWSSVKLSDPRVVPVLERFSHAINARMLTGGMIVKEFLA
ncbi:hypothetical protein D1007_20710 [Hordeum vulgare]|nr:hypothetical protein D1007_20710 [Hordeum vulgare]